MKLVLLSIIFCLIYPACFSQTNQDFMLDSSFANNGKLITHVNKNGFNYSTINTVLLQNDGRIIVAGYISHNNNNNDILLARYTLNGQIDRSFGDNGFVITDLGSYFDFASDAKLLSNGKVIVVGGTYSKFLLLKYNSNGTIDSSFGLNGKVDLPDAAYSIAVDKNDDIYVCGESGTNALKFTVRHYNKNGKADTAFGKNGLASVNIGHQQLSENPKIKLDNNDRIIVGGTSVVGTSPDDFIVIRFKKNGIIDSSFNKKGWCFANYNNEQNTLRDIAIQDDNSIICGGSSETSEDFTIVRITPSGKIDSMFGKYGFVTTDFNYNQPHRTYDYITALAIQGDKKIVASGSSLNFDLEGLFAVSRYYENGKLDTTFGFAGKLKTKFQNGKSRAGAMVLQQDGKIIVAGNSSSDINSNGAEGGDIAIVRYNKERLQSKEPLIYSMAHPVIKRDKLIIIALNQQ